MDGKVFYLRLYDVGGTIDIRKLKERVKDSTKKLKLSIQSFSSNYFDLPSYFVMETSCVNLETSFGCFEIEPEIKIFPIGVVSLSICVEFNGISFEKLNEYHELKIIDNGEEKELQTFFRKHFDDVMQKIKFALTEIYEIDVAPEIYTVFCVHNTDGISVDDLLSTHRKKLAGLITNDKTYKNLGEKQVDDILNWWFSYDKNDLTVLDWDAAFIVDSKKDFDAMLFVFEISNIMLLELKTYDIYLNKILEKAYRDIDKFYGKKLKFSIPSITLKEIIKTRMDFLKMTDQLTNTTKFLGEWFFAKVYNACTDKFHLNDWEKSINKKLATLNELYTVLSDSMRNRAALVLESSIVLLFIVDVIILVIPLIF
ncbi:MAG: hypothetical protein ABIA04_15195 [Pseudomonadota bacterium]